MLGNTYDGQNCSIARALEVVGERWTLLIIRDVLLGLHRFDELQDSLGIARNVLTARLGSLVEAGILERAPYQQRPLRHEYRVTPDGLALAVPVLALMHWGDAHRPAPAGKPRLTLHADCGGDVVTGLACTECGRVVPLSELDIEPGPALAPGRP